MPWWWRCGFSIKATTVPAINIPHMVSMLSTVRGVQSRILPPMRTGTVRARFPSALHDGLNTRWVFTSRSNTNIQYYEVRPDTLVIMVFVMFAAMLLAIPPDGPTDGR